MSEARLTIGMPVYNGAKYVEQALESVLMSTFGDFVLLVADNGSTDGTEDIIHRVAASDSRVRYHRHAENLGAAPNHNWVWNRADTEYFKLFAHDDLVQPTFLERCIEALDDDPDCVLAYTAVNHIDSDGNVTGTVDDVLQKMNHPDPVARFGHFVTRRNRATSIFGVVRRSAVDAGSLLDPYVGSDRSRLAQWALAGPWVHIAEPLLLRRDHEDTSVSAYPSEYDRIAWFDPNRKGSIIFPTWRRLRGFLDVIDEAGLTAQDRRRAIAYLAKWAVSPAYRPPAFRLFIRDPLMSAVLAARRLSA